MTSKTEPTAGYFPNVYQPSLCQPCDLSQLTAGFPVVPNQPCDLSRLTGQPPMAQSQNLKAKNTFCQMVPVCSRSDPIEVRSLSRELSRGAQGVLFSTGPAAEQRRSHLQCPADSKNRSEELNSQVLLPFSRYSLLAGLGSTGDNSTISASEITWDQSSLYFRRSYIFIMPS